MTDSPLWPPLEMSCFKCGRPVRLGVKYCDAVCEFGRPLAQHAVNPS